MHGPMYIKSTLMLSSHLCFIFLFSSATSILPDTVCTLGSVCRRTVRRTIWYSAVSYPFITFRDWQQLGRCAVWNTMKHHETPWNTTSNWFCGVSGRNFRHIYMTYELLITNYITSASDVSAQYSLSACRV